MERYIYELIKIAKYIRREGFKAFLKKLVQIYNLRIPVRYSIKVIDTDMMGSQNQTLLPLKETIQGDFYCNVPDLCEIQMLTYTNKGITSDLELSIRRDSINGDVIRKVRIKGEQIIDDGYTRFRFKPVKDSKGKVFFFELKSMGKPSAGVWYNPENDFVNLKLYKGGKPVGGSINFKAIANPKLRDSYELWILKNEPSRPELISQNHFSKEFFYKAKISIIVPVYNTEKRILTETIESVINQSYDKWELCLADGNSSKSHIKDILRSYAGKDSRIKVKFMNENKGIAGNSNEALSMAGGEYIALLDHDDTLAPFALFEVVKNIKENPDVDLIYSDCDRITVKGRRFAPFFKPRWSPHYLLSCNYLCHLNVFKKTLVDKIGGFREGYDGSQDYDLVLRITELTDRINHIPKILYHWRTVPESAARSSAAKPYANIAAKKALKEALDRRKLRGDVIDGPEKGFYRVKAKVTGYPKVSIIITSKDNSSVLKKCIDSIVSKTTYQNYEIVIMDNQSREARTFEYYKILESNPKNRVLRYDDRFNSSIINNYAVSQVDSRYVIFLDNDTEIISPQWIEAMLEHAQRKDVGAVGALLYYPNDTVQHAGIVLGMGGLAGYPHRGLRKASLGYFGRLRIIQNLSAVNASCLMTKREIFEQIGGFDENYSCVLNDIDFCLKIRERGYLIVYTPYAELYHHESLNRGYEDIPEKQPTLKKEIEYFHRKWKEVLAKGDPYYNPNLTLKRGDFSIRI
jgi:glycosyltransferase involved in cell wall biosynthesis